VYSLYIDESGDPADYIDRQTGNVIAGSSKHFTLAGIIVNELDAIHFKNDMKSIISKYFKSIQLPINFKLHYHPLRQEKYPYNILSGTDRKNLADDVFNVVINRECHLLSVTINLERHCLTYATPIHPRHYSLLLILERFEYFLRDKNSYGNAIYEQVEPRIQKKMQSAYRILPSLFKIANPTNFVKLNPKVKFSTPITEPILQFSDFIAYAIWLRSETKGQAQNRYQSIKSKYYNLDHFSSFERGNCEI
jgi:hypothetical protein